MKPATKLCCGRSKNLDRTALLDDPAGVHHRDAVRNRQRFFLIVGDEHRRDPEPALDLLDLHPHLLAQLGVEVAERFVEQEHDGLDDDRPGERDALLLATAELAREPLLQPVEADHGERVRDPGPGLVAADPAHPEAEGDVRLHRHVRKQRVVLERDADVSLVRRQTGNLPPAEPDLARRRRLESGNHPERGGLAAAARADQADDVALVGGERGIVDREMTAETLAYVAKLEPAHRPLPSDQQAHPEHLLDEDAPGDDGQHRQRTDRGDERVDA